VFPRPTESFRRNKQGGRNFQAIELDERSGLYVKVIEEYTDSNGTHLVGEELFITGKEQAIYFPRPEHSIITYGDQRKHHAIAIPAGEGRYVLDRRTGQVNLERGPAMFLPDPRFEVVVRRILDPHDVTLMYPGNSEALQVNQRYQQESAAQEAAAATMDALDAGTMRSIRGLTSTNYASASLASASALPDIQNFGGDAMSRSTTYRGARTITLDTKYEGAVSLNIWPGYAVLVTNKTGDRRVEMGPRTVLLEYDETIMALALSTGRPKNDEKLLRTGYLRTLNNVVSDRILVETRDLVRVAIGVSYRVNFIGDELQWFSLENYVQALTDHARSRLRNAAKQYDIRSFYLDTINIVRDELLGTPGADGRLGLTFEENGMHVYDVEVLSVDIQDQNVAALLNDAQGKALAGAIQLSIAEDATVRDARLQELERESSLERQSTWRQATELEWERGAAKHNADKRNEELRLLTLEERAKIITREIELEWERFAGVLNQTAATDAMEMERLVAETSEFIRRLEAVSPDMIKAIEVFGDQTLTATIITAMGPAAMAAGVTTADLLSRVFEGTPLESAAKTLAGRPLNGTSHTAVNA
jgi:major vault protein